MLLKSIKRGQYRRCTSDRKSRTCTLNRRCSTRWSFPGLPNKTKQTAPKPGNSWMCSSNIGRPPKSTPRRKKRNRPVYPYWARGGLPKSKSTCPASSFVPQLDPSFAVAPGGFALPGALGFRVQHRVLSRNEALRPAARSNPVEC